MSSDIIQDFYKTWTQYDQDAERKQVKYIDGLLETSKEMGSKLVQMFKKGKNAKNPVVQYYEENWFDHHITGTLSSSTITFSGYLQGEAISAASMQNHIKKYIVLERESDKMQCVCSAAPDYDAKTVTVTAHGYGSTLSNDSDATTYRIIGHISSDYDTTDAPRGLNRRRRFVSTQVFKDSFEIPWTREEMDMELVASEMDRAIRAQTYDLKQKRDTSILRMKPVYSGGEFKTALNTENSAMTGVLQWPRIAQKELANTNIYVNKTSGGVAQPIDIDDLNSLAHYLEYDERANFNMGNWAIAIHSIQNQYLADQFLESRDMTFDKDEIGYVVRTFVSKKGKRFKFIIDDYMPLDEITMLDLSDFTWGYYGKQNFRITQLAETMANVIKKKITFQVWGVKCKRPRQIGTIYGLPTTYTS